MKNETRIETGSNHATVTIGKLTVAFSYQTVIGFHDQNGTGPRGGWVISENQWGPTTGKHLNALDGGGKQGRLPRAEFEAAYENTLKAYGLI